MENDENTQGEKEKQIIKYTDDDIDKTGFELIPGKQTVMLLAGEKHDLSE